MKAQWRHIDIRAISIVLLAVLFIAAGTLHFLRAATFVRIVPPAFPAPLLLVQISGAFEILGGVGILWRRSRLLAAYGLLALLVAVFPANVFMALYPRKFADLASPLTLWLRLPVQPLLIAWLYATAVRTARR